MSTDEESDQLQPRPQPRPEPAPEMEPVLAPIRDQTLPEVAGRNWLKPAGLALLAAGLTMSVAFWGGFRAPAPRPAAVPVRAALVSHDPARAAPPVTLERQNAGGAISFREAADSPSAASRQAPKTCTNCWNEVHSGIDSGKGDPKDSLATPWRSSGPDPEQASKFGLPSEAFAGPRLGDVPAAWQQCPQK